jgi:hypothetical protein
MRVEITQEPTLGRLTVAMRENCHGDSSPPVDAIRFDGFHESIAPDPAALAAAVIASEWTGEVLDFGPAALSVDAAEAVRLIARDARLVTPIDGYRRNLCEGHLDVLVAPAPMAGSVLSAAPEARVLTRLVTWSGEFVSPLTRSSAGYVAGEVSTNADVLLSAWETSICLGLLFGGARLRSIVTPRPDLRHGRDYERFVEALRIIGVQLRSADAGRQWRNPSGEHPPPPKRRSREALVASVENA